MILRRNLLALGTAATVMLRTKPGASIIQDGATAIGPGASGRFINVDFTNRTSKVIARELFGVSTATMLDFNFALCNNTYFQTVSRSLNVPLLRFNCNSGSSGGNVWANLFANGPHGKPNWPVIAPLINNLWKIVDLTKCKIIMGFGGTSGAATDTNGWSVTDFAHALTVVVNHMRTTPGGDGKPINPKYWEIMNEPEISVATYNSVLQRLCGCGSRDRSDLCCYRPLLAKRQRASQIPDRCHERYTAWLAELACLSSLPRD